MSVTIRMQRAGGRNAPFYRVVVADSRRARDGRFLEKVGYYNPLSNPAQIHLDQERVRFWVKNGAQMSESVNALWKKVGGKLEDPLVTLAGASETSIA
jgi:small subunit ribosomal protein S16